MAQIYYATTNKGKIHSMEDAFKGYDVTIKQFDVDIPEPRLDDVEEISRYKVKFAFDQVKAPVIALDAGFYIPSLNGFPKAFVNFALETIGIEGILALVKGKPRECEFRQSVAYLDASMQHPKTFVTNIQGTIAENPRGTTEKYHWSKLSVIFIPKDYTRTMGELSHEEYNEWRASLKTKGKSASANFAEWFCDINNIKKI